MTELSGLVVGTLFRGEARQLVQWCNVHLSRGADALYVALDRPAAGLVDALPDDPRVHWLPVDAATWSRFYADSSAAVERKQVDAARWLARAAAADGHTFFAFIDADEVLDLRRPFTELAAEHPAAAAYTIGVREMWYDGHGLDEPFGATLAMRKVPARTDLTPVFGWRSQYLRNGMLGHDVGKTVYRVPIGAGAISVHGPLPGRLRGRTVVLGEDARLLHFDSGSVATWNHKWASRLSGDAVARGLGPHRQAQLRLFEPVLRRPPSEQRAFFDRFFRLDPAGTARLEADGTVERIDLSGLLEGPLPVPAASHADDLVQLPAKDARVDYQLAMVCDRNFVKPTFATMISVLAQLDPERSVRFVVLGDALDSSDVHHFRSLERLGRPVEVQVHDVTRDLDRDVGVAETGVSRSRATYGRVYLVDRLPEQRTVYLDGDVLATRDIAELFTMDLGGACIAGVPDSAALRAVEQPDSVSTEQRMRLTGIAGPDPLEYVNAGVLVLDLDNPGYRERALVARGLVARAGRALAQHDQDAVNIAFRGSKHRLPSTYNYMTQFYTSERAVADGLQARKYAAADASLIHFSGRIKPWLTADEEFYNGLYRQIVGRAEELLGVSCGFYFSHRPRVGHLDWSAEGWATNLTVEPLREDAPGSHDTDVEYVDATDSALYLRLSAAAYEHVLATGLVLRVEAGGAVLADLSLTDLGPQQAHLVERVAAGVRRLQVDLPALLAPAGGVARGVELSLVDPADPDGYRRHVAVADVLSSGPLTAATRDGLLRELGVTGQVTGLAKGWLQGSYRSTGDVAIVLHAGDELVVRRTPDVDPDGSRPLRFRAGHLVRRGYGTAGGRFVVCVAGTNVSLAGETPTAAEVLAEQASRPAREIAAGIGGRVRRLANRRR